MKLISTLKAVLPVAMIAVAVACGSPSGEKSVTVPCSGSKYFSNKKFFRASGLGESMDQATATKKALSNSRARLAADIQTTMKVVGDNYVNSTEFNNKEEITETFQENARTVVNQVLNNTRTICEEMTITKKTGNYKSYIALEVSAEEMAEAMNNALSKDEKMKANYNYEKFKETFDAEMAKLGE